MGLMGGEKKKESREGERIIKAAKKSSPGEEGKDVVGP